MAPEAVEAGEHRLARRQRVTLHLHVDEELRDDADQRTPEQHQPDLRRDVGPQDELAGRKADAARDDARTHQPPIVAWRLRQLTHLAQRQTVFGACHRLDGFYFSTQNGPPTLTDVIIQLTPNVLARPAAILE